MMPIESLQLARWLVRIVAVGAVALLLGSAAVAEARPRHADPAAQERSGREGNTHSREFVGEKTPIHTPTW